MSLALGPMSLHSRAAIGERKTVATGAPDVSKVR